MDNDRIIKQWNVGPEYADVVKALRGNRRSIVFTNGCFDVLHAGHVTLLNKAADLPWVRDPVLVVGLNSDRSVTAAKGPSRPIMSFDVRAYHLASLACVDYVIGFDEDTPSTLIGLLSPDVLVKGGEYDGKIVPGADHVRRRLGAVVFIPMVAGLSTTAIVERLGAVVDFESQVRS